MPRDEKPSVCLVDDEDVLCRSLKSKLEEDLFDVQACGEAEEALRLCGSRKFHCIAIDQTLKGGDGSQIIEAIKTDPAHINHKTPILFMSAHVKPEVHKRISTHVHAILIKPFERSEFARKVRELCKSKG